MNELFSLAYLEILAAWIAFLLNTVIQNTLQSKHIKVDTTRALSVCLIVIETSSCNSSNFRIATSYRGEKKKKNRKAMPKKNSLKICYLHPILLYLGIHAREVKAFPTEINKRAAEGICSEMK